MRRMLRTCMLAAAALAAADAVAADAGPPVQTPEAADPLSLAIYGDGWAQVWDRRAVTLAAGSNRLALDGVSRQIVPSSAVLRAAEGITLIDVLYDFALLTPDALLRRSLGGPVGVARVHPTSGERIIEDGTLLSIEGGALVRIGERIMTVPPDALVFRDVPADLRARPTLLARVETASAGRTTLALGYLTRGLGWSADYVALWDDVAGRLDLSGRATLSNTTGTDFPDAAVSLIAGTVNRETPVQGDRMMMGGRAAAAPMMAEAKALPERQPLADLHLYRLPQPVSLGDREIRQVSLLTLPNIPVRREYVSESPLEAFRQTGEPQPTHPQVRLLFDNGAAGAAGAPLPAGLVRVYAGSGEDLPRLVGEDRIAHIPAGAPVTLTPGDAFDLTVLRRQTDFARKGTPDAGASESAWRIELRNAGATAAMVKIVEVIRGDWNILAESSAHEKETAERVAWQLNVPAGGGAQLTYRVLVQP